MFNSKNIIVLFLLNLCLLFGVEAFGPGDGARLRQSLSNQMRNSEARALQGALNAIGAHADRMSNHMKILQILDKNSCLVTIATDTDNDVIHVTGINTSHLVENNYLPSNNIFFYFEINDYVFGEKIINNHIVLLDNGVFSYFTPLNVKKTVKSYKYIPFIPKKFKNDEIKYLNQNITKEELNILWKNFGYRIYKGKTECYGIKVNTHFIFDLNRNQKQADKFIKDSSYYHINFQDFIFYLNNGGKIFEYGLVNSYILCTRCKGTGIFKGQQCTRCLGDKRLLKKTPAYNLVTVNSLRNFTQKYLNKTNKTNKDSSENEKNLENQELDENIEINENNDEDKDDKEKSKN